MCTCTIKETLKEVETQNEKKYILKRKRLISSEEKKVVRLKFYTNFHKFHANVTEVIEGANFLATSFYK